MITSTNLLSISLGTLKSAQKGCFVFICFKNQSAPKLLQIFTTEGGMNTCFPSPFCHGEETFLCSRQSKMESRIRVSDLRHNYHFILGYVQLLHKQIVLLPGHFPRRSVDSPLIPARKTSIYNCYPFTTSPPHLP